MKPEVFSYTRWSTAPQTWGDSERRQLAQAEAWASRKGLALSDRSFRDAGVSAKAGRNLEDGALGELVKAAKPGDYILIEDNDRFSRQDPITALTNLRAVASRGINIVFLRTGVEVNRTNFSDMSVIVPNFFGALLANQENEKKAFRVRESWEKRYAELRSGKATRMPLPGWLERQGDAVVVNEGKAAIVKRIFALALSGMGYRRIAQLLNEENVPTFRGKTRWNAQSIHSQILRNRVVLGEYEMKQDKKPTGETFKVYPAVIDDKTFFAVNAKLQDRQKQTVPVKAVSACLTTGLTRCPSCGGAMAHMSTHRGDKVYRYLVCSANKAGQATKPECKSRVSYPAFEGSLLGLLCRSNKVARLLGQAEVQPDALAELRGKVTTLDTQANKLATVIADDPNPSKVLYGKLKAIEAEAETARAELLKLEAQAKATTPPAVAYELFQAELAAHVGKPEYRERIKSALRSIIERVEFVSTEAYQVVFKTGTKYQVEMMDNGVSMDFKV